MNRLLSVTGADALEFLQGQLTQDVSLVAGSRSLLSAWCNPTGRVIATMRLIPVTDGIGLILAANIATAVVERLSMYRFRAKADFSLSGPEWVAIAVQTQGDRDLLRRAALLPMPGESLFSQNIHAVRANEGHDYVELYAEASALKAAGLEFAQPMDDQQWRSAIIRAGVPTIATENTEKFTPHMLNLDRVGAINFDKGCYTGQEIVARTENRGRSRRRMMLYQSQKPGITSAEKVVKGDKVVGDVVNVSGTDVLAVTPLEIHDKPLSVAGIEITPTALPYKI